jgi:hypothetical protein
MKKCKPVIVDGNIIEDYWVLPDGNILSTKQDKPKTLRPGNTKTQNNYPKVVLCSNGVSKSYYVHRIVCEAYHKFPIPAGVTKTEWEQTPESVKHLLARSYQVNHIDHDHNNYHPSNLEWVSVKENSSKFQSHRKKKLDNNS